MIYIVLWLKKGDYITMTQALDILRSRFGYDQFRFQQEAIIDILAQRVVQYTI